MTPRSLSFRLIAGAAVWCVLALAVGGVVLSQLFRDYAEDHFHASLAVHLDILIRGSERDEENGAFLLKDRPQDPRFNRAYSGLYWQISAGGEPFATSRSLFDRTVQLATDIAPGGPVRLLRPGPEDQSLMVVAQTLIFDPGTEHFTYLVAGERRNIDAEIDRFNQVLIWSALLMALGLVAAMFIQVRFGLRPLHQVSQGLSQIRAGAAEKLEGDFPVEIEELADQVNILIDHNAAILERARTQVGNLAHALKTPLAVLHNEAQNTDGPAPEQIRRQLALMRGHIDHYLSRARTAATANLLHARTPVWPAVDRMARALRKIHQERDIEISLKGDTGAVFRGEKEDLDEMLGNLMDNACKWATSMVLVTVKSEANHVVIQIEDDGPGLDAKARRQALQRGIRLDENKPGTGLGLAIVSDISELYGGHFRLDNRINKLPGLRALLTLPAVLPARPIKSDSV